MYHIVPFIIWVHRYSDLLGFEEVPMIDDLYDDRLAAIDFTLLLGGTALLVASEQLGVESITAAGGILVALGVVAFTANMLLVIHRHRTVNMSPTPSDQTANSYSFSRSRARWRRICSRYISIC
ncbi:hypothetical protein ACFQHN_32690 [Natrialbaceae archaeon GCM10025896]